MSETEIMTGVTEEGDRGTGLNIDEALDDGCGSRSENGGIERCAQAAGGTGVGIQIRDKGCGSEGDGIATYVGGSNCARCSTTIREEEKEKGPRP